MQLNYCFSKGSRKCFWLSKMLLVLLYCWNIRNFMGWFLECFSKEDSIRIDYVGCFSYETKFCIHFLILQEFDIITLVIVTIRGLQKKMLILFLPQSKIRNISLNSKSQQLLALIYFTTVTLATKPKMLAEIQQK